MGIVYFYFYSIHFNESFLTNNGFTLFYCEKGNCYLAGNGSFAQVERFTKNFNNYFGEQVVVKTYSIKTDSALLIGDIEPRYFERDTMITINVASYKYPIYSSILHPVGVLDRSMHYDVWAGWLSKDMRETFELLSLMSNRKLVPDCLSNLWPVRYRKTSPFSQKFSLKSFIIRIKRVNSIRCEMSYRMSLMDKVKANPDMYEWVISDNGIGWHKKTKLIRGKKTYTYIRDDKVYRLDHTIENIGNPVFGSEAFYPFRYGDEVHIKKYKFLVFYLHVKRAIFHPEDRHLSYLFDDVLDFLINAITNNVFDYIPSLKVLAALRRLNIHWENSVNGFTHFQY